MIKRSQKFWVVYVRYRFIPEQCVRVAMEGFYLSRSLDLLYLTRESKDFFRYKF